MKETEQPAKQTPEQSNRAFEVIGDDGKLTEAFRESLPDGLGNHSIFDKYNGNLVEMIKGTINAQELVGKKADEWWQSDDPTIQEKKKEILGVPKDPKEYEYEIPDLPQEIETARITEFVDQARAKFQELGINKQQAKALIEWDLNNLAQKFEQERNEYQAQVEAATVELKKEWKGEKYKYNVEKVKDAMEHLGGSEWFSEPAIANNPKFIKWAFNNIVPLIDNDHLIEARQQQSFATLNDQLKAVEEKMYAYTGSTNDMTYRGFIKEREALLQKLPQKA